MVRASGATLAASASDARRLDAVCLLTKLEQTGADRLSAHQVGTDEEKKDEQVVINGLAVDEDELDIIQHTLQNEL